MTLTVGSLFSGYLGLDLAVQAALDTELVWCCDNDPGAAKIMDVWAPGVPNLGDITKVDWSTVPHVDVILGGFPCQDVSHAGKRLGLRPDTRSGLWSQMAYAIAQLRPRFVIIENVRGLLNADAHSDLEPCPWCVGGAEQREPDLRALGAVLGDLADLGYDTEWVGLRAADVGAPHGRFRVFILAADTTRGSESIQPQGIDRRALVGPELGAGHRVGLRGTAERVRVVGGGRGSVAAALDPDSLTQTGRTAAGLEGQAGPEAGPAAHPGGEAGNLGSGLRESKPRGGWRRRPDNDSASAAADPDRARPQGRGAHRQRRDQQPARPRSVEPAADAEGDRRHQGWPEPAGVLGGPDAAVGGAVAADPDGGGREGHSQLDRDPAHDPAERHSLGRHPDRRTVPADAADAEGEPGSLGHRDDVCAGGAAEQRGPTSGRGAAADPGRLDLQRRSDGGGVPRAQGEREGEGSQRQRVRDTAGDGRAVAWGRYAPAIERWERILGRVAPDPTEISPEWIKVRRRRLAGLTPGRIGFRGSVRPLLTEARRLNPVFVEWMMGLPQGWVTDVPDLSRNDQLKALGNGVVPQQAEAALRYLWTRLTSRQALNDPLDSPSTTTVP